MLNNIDFDEPLNLTLDQRNYMAAYFLRQFIDDTIRGHVMEFHRAMKLGFLCLDESPEDEPHEIVDVPGKDIFGQTGQILKSKRFECLCPQCQRSVSASRFAPHLASCMGLGRTSSRVASERIANAVKVESDIKIDSDFDDYDNDSDWNYNSDRKSTKKKRDRNTSKRANKTKARNGDSYLSELRYEVMSMEQKTAILDQVCGVVSEHTKKICTRSLRCHQHSEQQRQYVRDFVLERSCIASGGNEEVQIDVDTIEDDISALRAWSTSANSSPSCSSYFFPDASVVPKKKERKAASYTSRSLHNERPPKKSRSKLSQSSVSSAYHFNGSDLI